MDRVSVTGREPLQIRSGHTPVNLGLMVGSLVASVPAAITEHAQSRAVGGVLPEWAAYVFYVVLFLGSAVTLSATWSQLPTKLDPHNYLIIVNRLVRERVGHYAVAGILVCFSAASFAQGGVKGLSAVGWLIGIAVGLLFRAHQTKIDVRKLHEAMRTGDEVCADVVADPDDDA